MNPTDLPPWCPEGCLPCDGRPVPKDWPELLEFGPNLPDLSYDDEILNRMARGVAYIARWVINRDLEVMCVLSRD